MDVTERLVFAPSVEGLLVRGVGRELTQEARDELRAVGIDLDRPLLPGYPSATWHRALEVVARRVYPTLSFEEANLRMGERTVYGLEDTVIGKAMVAVARLLGPRRLMLRLPNTVKAGSNFALMEARELGPNDFELSSQPYMSCAQYLQGAIQAAIAVAGGTEIAVEIVSFDRGTERLVLRARWKS